MEPSAHLVVRAARRAAGRLRHPRRLRSRRRHPAPVRAQGRGTARVHELDRPALGRQRGVAGRLRRSAVRGLSARLRGGVLRVLHAVHAAPVRPDLPRRVDGVPQQAGLAARGGCSGTSPSARPARWRRSSSASLVGNCMLRPAARRATATSLGAVPLTDLLRPYPVLVGLFAVGHLRHARINLPVSENRGRIAAAHPRLDVADVRLLLALYMLVTIFTLTSIPAFDGEVPGTIRGCGSWWCSTCWPSPTSRARSTRAGRSTRSSRRRAPSRRSRSCSA